MAYSEVRERALKLTLPLAPSDNALKRSGITKAGKPYTYPTSEYKDWLKKAEEWARAQDTEILAGQVTSAMTVFFPTAAGDVTNRVKATHDFLQGVLVSDDSQIVAASQRREIDPEHPRVVVTIQPVNLGLFDGVDRRSGFDRRQPFRFDMQF